MKIRTQMLLVLAGVTLLPVCGAGLMAFRLSKQRLLAQADRNLAIFARLVAGEVDDFVFRAIEGARTDTLIPTLAHHLELPAAERPAAAGTITQVLLGATVHDPVNVTSCALLDAAGRKVVETATELQDLDESAQPWVTQPLHEGLPVVVASFVDPARPVLWVGAPIRSGTGAIIGLLRQRYELAALQQIAVRHSADHGAGQIAVVLNDRGHFLAHGGDAHLIGQTIPDGLLDELERSAGRYAPALQVSAAWNDPGAGQRPDRVALQALQHVPWIVAIVSTAATHAHAVDELQETMLLLAGLVVVLSTAAAAIAAARLGRPIVEVAAAAERIGAGELDIAVPTRHGGEVGALARAFNQMTARLRNTLGDLEQRMRQLRRSEEHLDALVAGLPIAAVVTDHGFNAVRLNRKFTEVFGYTAADLASVADWWRLAFPEPAYRAVVQADWLRRTAEAARLDCEVEPYIARVQCRDGSQRHIEFHSRPIGEFFVTTCTDLTERERAAQSLRESEERFRLLVENTSELIVLVAVGGRVLYASPNHAGIVGRTPAEMKGTNVLDHVHPDDLAMVQTNFSAGRASGLFRYRFADGSWHWLESSGARFKTDSGTEQAVIVSRDVTPRIEADQTRQRLEEQLRQAQKLEAIGTLAGGVAHDFNNILLGILGNNQLAAEELAEDHPARPLLAESHRASLRARDLVARILTFSRRSEPKLEAKALGPVVQEALHLLRASLSTEIAFAAQFDPATPSVLCDTTQIHQIVMNLGSNAGHAMRGGGTLTVSLAPVQPAADLRARFPQVQEKHTVRLSIADTGTGMDEATLKRLFEPFFTTKPVGEGTGLGLAVVHGLLRGLDGAITVESAPGRGTRFDVYLPGLKGAAAAEAVPAEKRYARGAGQRVALVDDEEVVRRVCERALRQLGYEPAVFSRADDLLTAFRAEPGSFAAVVSDLTMPGRNGLELARELRALRPDLPVILASGNSTRANSADLAAAGIAEVVEKPFSIAALGASLHRVLNGHRPE